MTNKRKHPPPKPHSPTARALAQPLYRQRKIKALKGKGSYKRRPKHRDGAFHLRVAVMAQSLSRNFSIYPIILDNHQR